MLATKPTRFVSVSSPPPFNIHALQGLSRLLATKEVARSETRKWIMNGHGQTL